MPGKRKAQKDERKSNEASVAEARPLSPQLVYEVIRREGVNELKRPTASLLWSGMAAGLLISFSAIGEAVLRASLPHSPFAHLVESIGYSFGFLLVILGRMQLFTENKITTVLPVVGKPNRRNLVLVARLWSVVFGANVTGAFLAAAFIAFTPAFPDATVAALADIAREATGHPASGTFFRGMPAGILIAAIVWMMPTTSSGKFPMVMLFTWLIAAGGFTHVIAGSVEMAFLILTGEMGLIEGFGGYLLPVLCGNIAGGTLIFTMLAWGQVKREVKEPEHPDADESLEKE